ncbi:dihydrodipicolinate synthase family protein [Paraflavitalea pollutisoli]|uniref:dihydrodipicolinate synthase family protein n=1 Tax=Paraflavitalea pollutisoli TaxID=3034143 RepID=UPI0023EB1215|nr:dihydrodipicolinate synthase family protein [Paraflavitalea sp. H1-2-19X]
MHFEWKGVFPALTTQFTPDDELDLPLFEKNIEAQIEAGVDGLILGGTLGEASVITIAEKEALVKTALQKAAGQVPVLLNIAEGSTREAINQATLAAKWGAQGLMLLPPMRYKSDHRETVEYFKTIASNTDLPIILYNNPVDYKIEITLDMFEELTECTNIGAVKESTRDVSNVTRMINRFGNRYKIMCGVDPLAMEELVMGADGWVAGLVDAFPRETVAIYRLVKAGQLEEAAAIYRWFMPLLDLDIDAKLVQYIKLASVATGIGSEHTRAPRLRIIGEERARVQAIIDEGMRTRPVLPDYLNLSVVNNYL